jgi:F-type H+-transporting ATPase subunit gamma
MAKNSTKEIKRRARSIENTRKVTRAMEMVSASKMRRSQARAFAARPYAQAALNILRRIASQPDAGAELAQAARRNVLLRGRPEATRALVLVVTSDKGLIGGMNAAVIASAKRLVAEYQERGSAVDVIVVGAKSKRELEKNAAAIIHTFEGAGDYVDSSQTSAIARALLKHYRDNDISEAVAVYTEFISTLKQRVTHRQLLPIQEHILRDLISKAQPQTGRFSEDEYALKEEETEPSFYTFEPRSNILLRQLLPLLFQTYIYHIILEANASEHSARMMAMRNASSNANRLLDDLMLSYNKARQSAITQEINEVSSGAAALGN